MCSGLRLAVAWMVSCLVGLSLSSVVASGAGVSDSQQGGNAGPSLEASLVVPGVDSLVGGQQTAAAMESLRASPDAVAAREASRTAYRAMTAAAAERLAREAFPDVVVHRSGVLSNLPAGQTVAGLPSDHVAQVDLAGGRHGVIESIEPLAIETSSGHREAIDLSLGEARGVFHPLRSDVSLRVPTRLGEGIGLPGIGVTLTPVDAHDSALSGSQGAADGAAVLYANTLTDSDTLVKPLAVGFEADTLLRSPDSPQQLFFKVGLPAGARLERASDGSGTVRVVDEGATIAAVLAPSATDAAGTQVPVSMSFSGDTLSLSVAHGANAYQYPIMVDPTVTDSRLNFSNTWKVEANGPFMFSEFFEFNTGISAWDHGAEYVRNQWAGMAYETQGESHIYGFITETSSSNPGSNIENKLYIVNPAKTIEKEQVMAATYANTKVELCVEAACAAGKVTAANQKNAAEFKQTVTNTGTEFTATMSSASVEILQEKNSSVSFDTTDKILPSGFANAAFPGNWAGPRSVFKATATDPGLGVFAAEFSSPGHPTWNKKEASWFGCGGVQCPQTSIGEGRAYGLPDGEDELEAKAENATKGAGTALVHIKVDFTAPYGITLSGLPANKELGEGSYKLQATAKDGSGSVKSSGVESIKLEIDGKQIGAASGSCAEGPCTATSEEWTINGSEYPAGQHQILVTATDRAGNVGTAEYVENTGHPATPVGIGPGSVSPETGEFFLKATDVSVGGPGAGLSLQRSFSSYHLTAGAEGPLGPQWAMSVGGSESLTKAAEGTVVLTGAEGLQSVFTPTGGGKFKSPTNSASLTLTEVIESEKTKEFLLSTASGVVTKFKLPSGGTGTTWVPSTLEGPGATNILTYSYKTTGGITEPTRVLGPVPAGVSCTAELVKGCRALGFVYDTKTTATGDGSSQWGEYEGRLKEVTFTAWDPASAKMTTTAVADYVYDKEGKLRGEWDPRVSPTLETTYGYDAAGHVTAFTPPGQQPWLFAYNTAPGDTRPRLLTTTRPAASTAAGNGLAPVNTVAPSLPYTPVARQGVPINVSIGTWSNTPLSYSYQWEGCETTGPFEFEVEVCKPILGATSPTYTPGTGYVGTNYKVQVTATNANGSITVATNKISWAIAGVSLKKMLSFASEGSEPGQVKEAAGIAVESASTSEENIWVADTGNNRIEKFKPGGTFVAAYGTKGKETNQFEKPTGIALDPTDKYVYVADSGNKRIEIFEAKTGKYVAQTAVTGTPLALAAGKLDPLGIENNYLFVTFSAGTSVTYFRINGSELLESKSFGSSGTGNGQFKEAVGVAVSEQEERGGKGNEVFVVDKGNHRVQVFQQILSLMEYVTQFGSSGSGEGQFSTPGNIAVEPQAGTYALKNEVLVADSGNSRVQQSTQTGANPFDWSLGTGSQSLAVSAKSGGGLQDIYVLSAGTGINRIARWIPEAAKIEPPEPPSPGTSAVSTVEYHVPVSGTGAPYGMGRTEVEKWGQKDFPFEATAIYPPDEPMGWPAKDYKRATVYYLDSKGHTVNIANPTGGISTSEYNAKGDVERALSPNNRSTALKEGVKSVEVSKLLDTQNTYSAEGTELLSSVGPQHNVKLPNGTQVEARKHTAYAYDEGAPAEGGPYGLPTKITEGAQFAGKEEDVRETKMSYSGQGNLGWKLHKATSVTTDPSGLKLVNTVVYDPATGNVVETRSPAGSAGGSESTEPPTYSTSFGSFGTGNGELKAPKGLALNAKGELLVADEDNNRVEVFKEEAGVMKFSKTIGALGTGAGQMKEPRGVAVDSKGNIWVMDTSNNRVDEFNEKEEFVRTFGFGVSNEAENTFQICTASCHAGKAGSGAKGQFNAAKGIAVDKSNNVLVADSGNNRIQKFNEKGEWVATWGSAGTGEVQFKEPRGISVAPNGLIWIADTANNRVEVLKEDGTFSKAYGSVGTENGQFKEPKAMFVDTHGKVWVSDSENNRVQVLDGEGKYQYQFGSGGTGAGQFKETWGVELDTHGNVFVTDAENARIQKWIASGGGAEAHDSQTIYYTTAANAKYPGCGEHAEWANLPCQTQPAKQPETAGLPNLPVGTVTYNIWDEAEKTVETVGSTTRTGTLTYDAAGRVKTSAVSSSVGTALPTVTDEYNTSTGMLEKQSATIAGKVKTIVQARNSLGEMTSYSDADENTATYTYDIDGRVEQLNDGKGTQTYTYATNSGLPVQLVDSAAGTFHVGYDLEGNMLTDEYPNGMTATYTYDAGGNATSLTYVKTTHCTTGCTWFSDAVVPSIHAQWMSQTSTLSSVPFSNQAYSYDTAGRLTQVQNTPGSEGCTTRIYVNDEETDRTSLTTRAPGTGGVCATTGGTAENHTYDSADRLLDAGTAYSTFGNITALPAKDAGGFELTSAYYVNNQLASQTQNGQTIGYNLDPAGRTREIVSTGKVVSTVTNHFAGSGSAPAWTVNTLSAWTRNIAGIGGGLVATQNNGETPVLQLTNLHGDIVATASKSETAEKLASTTDTSEFGVPTTSTPPKYSWLGANELATELPSGAINMGARSYIPQLGRFLQTDPVSGGSANAYSYTFGDPVNTSDPSGELTYGFSGWLKEQNNQEAQEVAARETAREALEREEAERRAEEAAAAAAAAGPQAAAEVPLGGYEAWACEYAQETGQEEGLACGAFNVIPDQYCYADGRCHGTNSGGYNEHSHSRPEPSKNTGCAGVGKVIGGGECTSTPKDPTEGKDKGGGSRPGSSGSGEPPPDEGGVGGAGGGGGVGWPNKE
jgi:RHS repeat-associated protein